MGCKKFFPVDITYKFLNIKGPTVQKDATQKQLGPCEPLLSFDFSLIGIFEHDLSDGVWSQLNWAQIHFKNGPNQIVVTTGLNLVVKKLFFYVVNWTKFDSPNKHIRIIFE